MVRAFGLLVFVFLSVVAAFLAQARNFNPPSVAAQFYQQTQKAKTPGGLLPLVKLLPNDRVSIREYFAKNHLTEMPLPRFSYFDRTDTLFLETSKFQFSIQVLQGSPLVLQVNHRVFRFEKADSLQEIVAVLTRELDPKVETTKSSLYQILVPFADAQMMWPSTTSNSSGFNQMMTPMVLLMGWQMYSSQQMAEEKKIKREEKQAERDRKEADRIFSKIFGDDSVARVEIFDLKCSSTTAEADIVVNNSHYYAFVEDQGKVDFLKDRDGCRFDRLGAQFQPHKCKKEPIKVSDVDNILSPRDLLRCCKNVTCKNMLDKTIANKRFNESSKAPVGPMTPSNGAQ